MAHITLQSIAAATLTTLFLLFSNTAFAQLNKTFSTDQSEFLKEFEDFMTSSKSNLMEDSWKSFEKEIIKTGAIGSEQWDTVISVSNVMRSKRMTSTYFLPYMRMLQYMQKKENALDNFNQWHDIWRDMLTDSEALRLNKLKSFLEFSANFYELGMLSYRKLGTSWRATSTQLKMDYKNQTVTLDFDETDLIAVRNEDSISILGTTGIYDPVENIWKGEGGKVDWGRYGFPNIYADLESYEIDMSKPGYSAPSVNLHHPTYFPKRVVKGSFEDGVSALRDSATTGRFPQFSSFDSVLQIDEIGEGIRYRGGFQLQGTTVYGLGRGDRSAQLEVFSTKGERVFRGLSDRFAIQQGEQVGSKSVQTTVYYGQDSITHPSLLLRYNIPTRTFTFNRADDAGGRNPFFDSYQKMNIDVETMEWTVGTDSIILGKRTIGFGTKADEATFQSLGYYSEAEYRRMQSLGSYNPIATFRRVAREQGTDLLDANMLATELNPNLTLERIQGLLFDMAEKGFVDYNSEKKKVLIKEKLYHYADAGIKRSDYDHISITSKVNRAANARLNLDDRSININGVENIEFSPKQKVAAKPYGEQLIMKGDRNMDFSGRIFAGYSVFNGKDYHFNYQPFNIKMDSVRHMDLFVPNGEEDRDGNPIATALGSRIEHVTGTLLIDAPINKSGTKDIPLFPAFNSEGPAYVFYDDPATLGGVYKRDSFYFELDPFSLNGLDNLQAEQVKFDGTLVSAEIFEEIKERLEIQEDESLGLYTETPKDGQGIYQSKGTHTGSMSLSNEGFFGKGTLNYLGTSIESKDFTYKPKQMLCSAEEFKLKEDRGDPEFPYAYGIGVNIDWRPYSDSMYIKSEEAPFELFTAKDYFLKGVLILTPSDLRANGELDWPNATFNSNDMSMGAYSASADTSGIKIKALVEEGEIVLSNANVKANIDFDKQFGSFESNSGDVATSLPYNFYETSMNSFDWEMDNKRIIFKNAEGVLSNFRSTHPDKDSLLFQGTEASYDLVSSELRIGGIPFIRTCDALIYPDSNKAVVRKGGDMDSLLDARIIASVENREHEITRATVDIQGAKDFRAKGYYQYNVGPWEQEIYFDNIVGSRVGKGKRNEKATETRATGTVDEESEFHIDHKTEFTGTISLNSKSSALHFDGFARLDVPILPQREFFSLNSDGDKRDLTIEFDEPKTYGGEPVRAGFYLSKETGEVYPRIMQPLFFRKDRPIMDARGFFKYDEDKKRFLFGDSTKVIGNKNKGTILDYNVISGKIFAEGPIQIGSGLNYVKVRAAGTLTSAFSAEADSFKIQGAIPAEEEPIDGVAATDSLMQDSTFQDSTLVDDPFSFDDDPFEMVEIPRIAEKVEAKLMVGVSFPLPDNLMTILLTDLNASSFTSPQVNHVPLPFYEKALAEIIDNEKALPEIYSDLRSANDLNIPRKDNPFTFLFSKLDMFWNPDYQSWLSEDNQIGVSSINGVTINKMLKAFVEFRMPGNGDDRMYIYIESPGGYFYFFGYKQGIMNVVSNNTTFNDAVLGLKNKELIQKMDDKGFYEIQLVEQGSARAFANRVLEGRK